METVPLRYRCTMAMNLRLTDDETEVLRRKAREEGRSMQEVARSAIAQYTSDRPARLRAAIDRVLTEDAELLRRLAQ
jgi:predicted transcriptional regulator